MNVRRLLLIGANLALGSALAIVLTSAPEEPNLVVPEPSARRSSPAGESPIELASSKTPPTSRPLFTRRQAPPIVEVIVKSVLPEAPAFRLAGVLWADVERLAIVQMPGDAGHRRVRPGETVDEWTLSELTPRTALFVAGERKSMLNLTTAIKVE